MARFFAPSAAAPGDAEMPCRGNSAVLGDAPASSQDPAGMTAAVDLAGGATAR